MKRWDKVRMSTMTTTEAGRWVIVLLSAVNDISDGKSWSLVAHLYERGVCESETKLEHTFRYGSFC